MEKLYKDLTRDDIALMTMSEYLEFRSSVASGITYVSTCDDYTYCRNKFAETGEEYWFNRMLDNVKPL